MKDDRIQRFTPAEVVFHWLQAVLYLVLAITGSAILFERLFEVQTAVHRTLAVAHRITGIILLFVLAQTILLSLFTGMFRQFWRTLRQCLSWGREDVLWLVKVPLNMFSKSVSLPPVGRFNPGQKMHILVVFTVLIGFAFSGLAIMLIPGALAPWIIHLVCFMPAAFFLVLHLFLVLTNPSTRESLPSIFTGFISHSYAKEHHALMLGKANATVHKSYVSWLAALLFLLAIGTVFGASVWKHGFGRFAGNMSHLIALRGASLIMPGDLCASHAVEPETAQCTTCHNAFGPISSKACLECHEKIEKVIANGVGYHGTLTSPCRGCHVEHLGEKGDIRRLDAAAFNHNLARFGLDGKHRELPCDKCHLRDDTDGAQKRTQYIGLDFTACSDCHGNPHEDARAANCVKCHTVGGWKEPNLLFVHNRDSQFRLEGKHSDTSCEKCHVSQTDSGDGSKFVFYGIGTDCSECHRDPHNGQFEKSCESCHSEQGWKGRWLVEAHGPSSSYPLRGKHATVDCLKCHTPPEPGVVLAEARFAGLSQKCASCHEDPHGGQMRSECETCHEEQGWTGRDLLFTHDQHSEFKLDPLHVNLACMSCHAGADAPHYRPLPKTCELCHTNIVRQQLAEGYPEVAKPDPHANRVSCIQCHPPDRPNQTPADYASDCRACHNPYYEGLFYNWMKSFGTREYQAELLLKCLRDQNAFEAEVVEQKIKQAKKIGFHNFLLALYLWDEILIDGLDTSVQNGTGSTEATDE